MTNMPFVKLVTEHRGGDLEARCSDKLTELLEGLRDYGGKGELNLKLKFKQNKYGQVEVDADVKAKIPEPDVKGSVFFLTEDGELTRRDPNQADIEDVPGVKREGRSLRVAAE